MIFFQSIYLYTKLILKFILNHCQIRLIARSHGCSRTFRYRLLYENNNTKLKCNLQALPIQSKFFPLMTRKHIETLVKKMPFDRESFLWAQSAVVTRNFQGKDTQSSYDCTYFIVLKGQKQILNHQTGL